MDGKFEQQDTKLNLRLADSLLLGKVDPLNRSIESLQVRTNGLLALQQELARLQKGNAAAAERESLNHQISSESAAINATRTKLRLRHAALLQEATARGLILDDLDELNF